jgi:hypothetical protein
MRSRRARAFRNRCGPATISTRPARCTLAAPGRASRPGPRRDLAEVRCQARVIAGRQTPYAAGVLPGRQVLHQLDDVRRERGGGQDKRIVVHHQRPEGRHTLDDPIDLDSIQAVSERQHPCVDAAIDAIAEFHDKCRITG